MILSCRIKPVQRTAYRVRCILYTIPMMIITNPISSLYMTTNITTDKYIATVNNYTVIIVRGERVGTAMIKNSTNSTLHRHQMKQQPYGTNKRINIGEEFFNNRLV